MTLKLMKRMYNKAIKDNKDMKDVIKIEGHEFIIGYLKYLIQYLETCGVDENKQLNLTLTGEV